MYVPVILDFENYGSKFMLLKYLRFFDVCYQNEWPIITHEEFEKYELNFPGRNEYTKMMMNKYHYELYTYEERQSVHQFFIPQSFYKNLERDKGSKLDMSVSLLNEENETLECLLQQYFDEIEKNIGHIDGVLYFAACPLSLKKLCERRQIKMVAYETGPIRQDNYRCDLSYFCREGVYNTHEIEERYNKFCTEVVNYANYTELTREEILCMFLSHNNLGFLSQIDRIPKYEIGVAGSCALVVPFFAQNKYMDNEMINDVFEQYHYGEVLVRLHPYDLYTATYRMSKVDKSDSIFPFILQSKRVAAVGSNVLFEAMLWKKIACSKTKVMPSNLMCSDNYTEEKEQEDIVSFINFFIFSFLVPMELAYDEEYIQWRLSDPSELEIYLYHRNYYVNKFGLKEQWLTLDSGKRLEILKAYRNYKPMSEEEFLSRINVVMLNQNNNEWENKYKDLEQKYDETTVWLNAMLNSNMWKITKPLRVLLDFLKGIR